MHISVLISTYGDRVNDLPAVIHDAQPGVTYYICHQGGTEVQAIDLLAKRDDVVYFKSETRGVTKSRNLLIDKALKTTTDILYFCDDDVTLAPGYADSLRAGFTQYDADVLTFEVLNERGQPRKVYPEAGAERSKRNILSVGTVEVAVRAMAVGTRRFPADLGAGSSLPVGDEAVFLAQFIDAGFKIQHVNAAVCRHPDESSGATAGLEFNEARGVTIRRVFGSTKGFVVLFYFMFLRRQLIFNRAKFSHRSAACSLLRGFFRA